MIPKRTLTMVCFLLAGCIGAFTGQKLMHEDVRQGKYWDQAVEVSVNEFFQKRMSNVISMMAGTNWKIIHESKVFVYFGRNSVDSQRRGFTRELYKCNREELANHFPQYATFDGIKAKDLVKEKLNDRISDLERVGSFHIECRSDGPNKYELGQKWITIERSLKCSANGGRYRNVHIVIQIDKYDIDKVVVTENIHDSKAAATMQSIGTTSAGFKFH